MAHVAGDSNDRKLLAEVGKARFGGLWTEEDQRLAAVVQERFDGAALVAAGCHSTECDVVSGGFGGQVDALQEISMERLAGIEHHAEESGPAACQELRPRVGSVSELRRAGQHSLAGLLAGARRTADD